MYQSIHTYNHAVSAGIPIWVIADKNLEADDFRFKQIFGLTHSCDPLGFGYLCVCKDRSGSPRFWDWFWRCLVDSYVQVKQTLGDGVQY